MRVVALLNAAAGTLVSSGGSKDSANDATARVRQALEDAGIAAEVRAVEGSKLGETAKAAAAEGVDAVIAGGGDGTVSAVAGALVGGETPLGVLPLGTLNHFAKDLGIPRELHAAARALAAATPRALDAGEVNGRVFINNSSIGLYAEMVRERDELRYRLGHGKWRAMLRAGANIFRRYPTVEVHLADSTTSRRLITPFVFVGNNEYQIDFFALGARACLDRGHLSLYLAHRSGRFGLIRLSILALLGRLNQARDFESMCLPELRIDARRRRLHVALDGEVVAMTPPLHYRVRARALRVLCPVGKAMHSG